MRTRYARYEECELFFEDYVGEFEGMSEEEIDELFRPKKTNSRKSLAPLFVYLILKTCSSEAKPLSQNDIIRRLGDDPYEISIERKAVSRIIHLLADAGLNIVSSRRGAWYDGKKNGGPDDRREED